jgi:serine/threonine protein kinase/Tol biopolymer transport system component
VKGGLQRDVLMTDAKRRGRKKQDDEETTPSAEMPDSLKGPGSRIGQFEVEREIGRGGMGVVYLAHDTKLDRKVAIKTLPAELMKNHKARSRFSREARVLASLNHPNIATIYEELKEEEGTGFLVLEYVPGETLAERIACTSLKLKEALSIGQQIAEAVAAAHEKNVIHRDLKAGNIKMTPEGKVKVLDFGLARAVSGEALDQESTITEPGRIIGTPAYMSPEQARGKQADKRSDIWSFGCVLYEMLTGKVPFEGGTPSDTLAGILEREPDWLALPQDTPANIHVMLRRCLTKDPRCRLQHIGDAAIEIRETLSGALEAYDLPGKVATVSRLFRRDVALVALVCSIAGMLIAGSIFMYLVKPGPLEPPGVLRLPFKVPADKPLYQGYAPNHFLAISPDSTCLVYVGELDNGDPQLNMWSMDDPQIKPIRGTRNAHNPFFSPDGQWVGFFTEKQLKKVLVAGGEPVTLHENILGGVAAFGSWTDDGTIVFSDCSGSRCIQRIPDSGSGGKQAETLVARVPEDGEAYYCYPQVLPGGNAILYSHVYSNLSRTSCIKAFLPETGKRQTVLDNASYATYVSSGHLIFVRDNVLMAAPFDVEQLKPTGREVTLGNDHVGFDWTGDTPQITISGDGTIVYISGSELRKRELVWVDRQGKPKSLGAAVNVYEGPSLSPDGQRIAVGVRSQKEDNIRVYVYNVQLGTFMPLTPEGESCYPQWSPDETRIAFWGRAPGTEEKGVFCKVVGAGAPAERLASKPSPRGFMHPYSWSKNLLACTVWDPNTQEDIWVVDTDGEQEPKPVLRTEHREYNPTFSPDGRWLAYVSEELNQEELDQPEIYLLEYPDAGQSWPIPTRGAINPVWSRDGRELYYISDNTMMAVKVTSDTNFPIGKPELLFELPMIESSGRRLVRCYDVSDDGRFLMLKRSDDTEDQLIFVQNWFEELKQLAPPRKNK